MDDKKYLIAIAIYVGLAYILALLSKPAELAGFAVVGALALVFLKLDSFKEFSGGGFSAKLKERVDNIENDLAPIKSKETEPEGKEKLIETTNVKPDEVFLDADSQKVLFALTTGKYSWRSLGGIKTETKLRPSNILNILLSFEKDGIARRGRSTSGSEIWGATDKGHSVEQLHYPGSDRENA